MDYINDVWSEVLPSINWVVFVIVLASGYFIRSTPILPKSSTTFKVLMFSSIVSGLYAMANELDLDVFIASYFIAFGFHSAILRGFEKKLTSIKKRLIGNRPDDR